MLEKSIGFRVRVRKLDLGLGLVQGHSPLLHILMVRVDV